ncbi:zinc finger protein 846-like isoform X2 [Eurosta solidaginis]|uniref:zinc finger protein 846-like isoform X2 n=1 Tax=Eurosta solidaginis TaxID=178769 RepID=UPI0035315690
MALVCKEGIINFHDMTICGEIGAILSASRQQFFLNCKFCDNTFLQLDSFVDHVCEVHFNEFSSEVSGSLKRQLKEEAKWDEIRADPFNFLDVNHEEEIDFKSFEKRDMDINVIKKSGKLSDCHENTFFVELMTRLTFKQQDDTELPQNINEGKGVTETACIGGTDQLGIHSTKHCKQKDLSLLKNAKKKFTLDLIYLYRNLPALWNINSEAFKNLPLQNEQLEILLTKYRERYPNATKEDVKKKMAYLLANFKRELRKTGSSGISSLYYFNEMLFLKDLTQSSEFTNLDETKDTKEKIKAKFQIPDSSLNGAQAINLAKIYRRHTCLWDENDITYRFTNRRQEALDNILSEFRKTSGLTDLTKNDLEKEIRGLRKLCSTEKKRKIACKQTNTTFSSTSAFYNHIEFLEVNVPPYECPLCGDLISAWTVYKKHLSSHDGSLPYKCQVCGHGFKLLNNYTVHLRAHAQDYTFSCEVCSKSVATTTQLKTHMRTHTGEKPFVCHICGKVYTGKSAYLVHMQRHENKPRHKCYICSKLFYNKQMLKEHINAHLQLRNYKCKVCDKGFTSAKHLRQHKQIHSEEKKYLCKICEKRFAQAAGLNSHMKSHGIWLQDARSMRLLYIFKEENVQSE